MPICAYPGKKADHEGRRAHQRNGDEKCVFAPTTSPMRPNTSAPNGRTAKPAAKLSSVKMNAAAGIDAGEDAFGNLYG